MTYTFIFKIRKIMVRVNVGGNLLTQTSGALFCMQLNTFVVFLTDGVLCNKDRLGLVTEMLVCQALQVLNQTGANYGIYPYL